MAYNDRNSRDNEIIAVIDVGSHSIKCLIARIVGNNTKIIGCTKKLAKGMSGGAITNFSQLFQSISKTVQEAEKQARITVTQIYTNLPLQLCQSHNIAVSLNLNGQAVTATHLSSIIKRAASYDHFKEHEVIHAIAHDYRLDNCSGITNPIGLRGEKITAKVHVIAAYKKDFLNLINCIEKCHLQVQWLVSSPFAAGLACLVDDEKQIGTIIIDIGASSTNYGIFHNGHFINSGFVPIGGQHITNDLVKVLKTTNEYGERIKNLYGSAVLSHVQASGSVKIPIIGGQRQYQNITRSMIVSIIRPRVEEIFERCAIGMRNMNIAHLHSFDIVLTGGGSQLPGITEIASMIMSRRVRIGTPMNLMRKESNHTNEYSVAAGMIEYGRLAYNESIRSRKNKKISLVRRISMWLKENI